MRPVVGSRRSGKPSLLQAYRSWKTLLGMGAGKGLVKEGRIWLGSQVACRAHAAHDSMLNVCGLSLSLSLFLFKLYTCLKLETNILQASMIARAFECQHKLYSYSNHSSLRMPNSKRQHESLHRLSPTAVSRLVALRAAPAGALPCAFPPARPAKRGERASTVLLCSATSFVDVKKRSTVPTTCCNRSS